MTIPKSKHKRKQSVDQSVYELALDRIRRLYALHDTIIVSFSGGKDSTVVLNLTAQVAAELGRLPVRVVSFDEEAIAYETEDYMRRCAQRPDLAFEWYCVPMKHRNACSNEESWWYPWHPNDREKWVRPMPPEAITEIPGYDGVGNPSSISDISCIISNNVSLGRVCWLLGIRADESMTRRRAVLARTYDNYLIRVVQGDSWGSPSIPVLTPQYKAYPIYDWTTEDVWTAPAKFGWDYSSAYDLMEMIGVPAAKQRLAPPFGEQPMRGLYIWRECFPDIWDRLQMRVPGAATGARYSRTELYAAGDTIAKPPNMSWEEYIASLIARHPDEKVKRQTARKVRNAIRMHYRLTTDPIASKAYHPISGINWYSLAKLAERGDTKDRWTRKLIGDDPDVLARAWEKYRANLQEEE